MEFVDSNCTKHAAVAVRRIYSLSTASLLAAVTAWNSAPRFCRIRCSSPDLTRPLSEHIVRNSSAGFIRSRKYEVV